MIFFLIPIAALFGFLYGESKGYNRGVQDEMRRKYPTKL